MRRVLLSTRRFLVEERTVVRDGTTVTGQFVVHPGAVVILPILDPSTIVMIRNDRPAVGGELWELPAGTKEPGETAAQTASRELQEETGYQACVLQPFLRFYTSPGILTELMEAFLATDLTHVGQRLEPTEHIRVEVVKILDVRRMFERGELRDGKTIAVLGTYFARERIQ